jgi:hypothetical protein
MKTQKLFNIALYGAMTLTLALQVTFLLLGMSTASNTIAVAYLAYCAALTIGYGLGLRQADEWSRARADRDAARLREHFNRPGDAWQWPMNVSDDLKEGN